jgi:DNA-binding GntR family transcriptional regulator
MTKPFSRNRKDAPPVAAEAPKRGGLEAEAFVEHSLLQAVMERRLKPGAKLDEDVLSEVFNISRTRLRKVLSLLGTQQVVTHKLGYGTFVAKPSAAEARELFDVRHGIEQMLVRMVGAQQPRPDFTPLRRIVEEERRVHDHHNAGAIQLSGDFHLILADLAGNKLLRSYLQQLVTRTILVLALYSSGHVCLVDDHAEVLDALERGDTGTAAERMARHLRSIEDSCVLRETDENAVDLRTIFQPALTSA